MSIAVARETKSKSLRDAELRQQLQRLRQTDNLSNWFYLGRAYLLIALVITGTLWFFQFRIEAELAFWWNVPVTLLAILSIGACQHQLTGLAHEAVHHVLFKNKILNDVVSDWLCMFPMFSSTHHYRLAHLAHHQYVNDPDRDPDVIQQRTSGHYLGSPHTKGELIKMFLKQLLIVNLIRYTRVRAKVDSLGSNQNPYIPPGHEQSKLPVRIGLLYLVSLVGSLAGLVLLGDPLWLAVAPAAMWLGITTIYSFVPDRLFHQSRVHRVISARLMTQMRMTFYTTLFTGLAWSALLVNIWTPVYFWFLWIVPMFTTFSLYMVLRQMVQHGNADRGWITNTRVFQMNPLVRFAVFPIGQDYHLPHHMFATIPHYRLSKLHKLLLDYPEYRDEAVVVEGYFLPRHRPPTNPTVLEVLGPEFAPHMEHEAFIDRSLEDEGQVAADGKTPDRRVA